MTVSVLVLAAAAAVLSAHAAGLRGRPERPAALTLAGLAAVGLLLWIIYLITSNDTLAWVAFILLLPVARLCFTMFARWLGSRKDSSTVDSSLPMPVVLAHGVFAATTLVLVLLTALNES